MERIAVLGPGGVGGFLAAALARSGSEVTVVAREETARLITDQGIEVESVRLGRFRCHPAATARLQEPVDLLLVAAKAPALDAALERVGPTPRLTVPLLNGLDHMRTLRARFGPDRVAAGTIRIEADRPEPGRVVHTSQFLRVDLAADDPALAEELPATARVLEAASVPVRIGESEAQILWSKLVRLNALALTTSASDEPIGYIRSDPHWRRDLEGCLAEAAAVARAEGAELDAAAPLRELEEAHAELGSSMRRDIAAGRAPELDAIAGSVLRAGAKRGLPCPTVRRLADEVARRAGIEPPRVGIEPPRAG